MIYELVIGITWSIFFLLALNAFWKRALHLHMHIYESLFFQNMISKLGIGIAIANSIFGLNAYRV